MDLKELLAPLAKDVAVNLNQANGTEISIYTIPTGKVGLPIAIVLHDFSAAVSNAVITVGKTGGSCDEFLSDQTLTNISAAGDFLILMPVPAAIPVKLVEFAAAEVIGIEITTTEGSALTCKADVYGRLRDA